MLMDFIAAIGTDADVMAQFILSPITAEATSPWCYYPPCAPGQVLLCPQIPSGSSKLLPVFSVLLIQ